VELLGGDAALLPNRWLYEPELVDSGNVLSASPGLIVQGGGIYTPGFPLTLTNSVVKHNTPDQCYGC
jgi:hypothetical protein